MSGEEKLLRDALRNAPTPQAAPGFGARVVERAARRRRVRRVATAVATASVCVGVVGAAFTLDLARGPSRNSAGSTNISSATPPSTVGLDCARPPEPPKTPVDGSPAVPTGAIAARLCGGLIDNAGFDQLWPADTLRDDYVQPLVAHLNGLPKYRQPEYCELIGGPSFEIELLYRDGSKIWIEGATGGNCAHIEVQGGEAWGGAEGVLRQALALIEDQRAVVGRAASVEPANCPQSWQDVFNTAGAAPFTTGSRVAITACRYHLGPPKPNRITQSWQGTLRAQLAVEDPRTFLKLLAESSRFSPCDGRDYDLDRTQDILLIRDAFGDQHVVSTTPCWPNQATGQRRYPSDSLANAVADLFTQPTEQP